MSGVVADQHISVKSENNITSNQNTIASEDATDYEMINKPTLFTHVSIDRIKCEIDDVKDITDQDNISTELEINSNMGSGTLTTRNIVLDGIKTENDEVNQDMTSTENNINNELECGSTITKDFFTVNVKLENIQEDNAEEFTNNQVYNSTLLVDEGNKSVKDEIDDMMNQDGSCESRNNISVKQECLYLGEDCCLDNGLFSLEKAGSSATGVQQIMKEVTHQDLTADDGYSDSELSLTHIKAETPRRHIKVYSARKQYSCNTCNEIFYSKTNLTIHLRVHSSKQFDTLQTGETCKGVFKTKSVVSNHSQTVLNNKPIHSDNKAISSSNVSSTKNTIMDTSIKLYKCDLCKIVYVHKDNFISHMSKHACERQLLCELCSRMFKNKSTHKRHMMIHTGEKPFSCGICHKQFNVKGNLKSHLLTHSGEKPFLCGICHKTFSQKPLLKCHMKIHSEGKPFSCDLCNRSFNRKGTLICHIKTHSKQKPYKCGICRKKFSQKPHLKYHIKRKHSKEKPFLCDICDKAFSVKSCLKAHMNSHLRKKPFPLEISTE